MATGTGTKVLLVEDEPADAALIVRELEKSGLRFISECVDQQDTLVQALRDFGPDIVLCDNHLPGFDASRAMQICTRVPRRSADRDRHRDDGRRSRCRAGQGRGG